MLNPIMEKLQFPKPQPLIGAGGVKLPFRDRGRPRCGRRSRGAGARPPDDLSLPHSGCLIILKLKFWVCGTTCQLWGGKEPGVTESVRPNRLQLREIKVHAVFINRKVPEKPTRCVA